MAKWTSGRSERTLNQSAANGRNEPTLTNAAKPMNVRNRRRRCAARDPSERYVDIADRLCEQGHFGCKTGRGWYRYEGKTAVDDPDVTALILAESTRKGISRRTFSDTQIIDQILTTMQTDGQAILEKGIAARADDIDVVMVNGYGFPRWRGGPMFLRG